MAFPCASSWLALAVALTLLSPAAHAQASRPAPIALSVSVPGAPVWPARFGEPPAAAGASWALRPASPADVIVAEEAIAYDWYWHDTVWQNPVHQIMTYDAAARLIGIEFSDSLTGANPSRQTFTYNARGQLTERLFEGPIAGTWYPLERYVYTFDPAGNPLESRREGGNGTTWVIRNATQHEYQYDAAGRVTQDIYRSYDNLYARFVNLTRTSYTYAGGPRWNTLLTERWDPVAGGWKNSAKFIDPVYDSSLVPRLLSYRIQGWTGTAFVEIARTTFTWDSNGGWIELRESYDAAQGWQNDWRTSQTFTSYGDPLEWRSERWTPPSGWNQEYGFRSLSTYQPTGERVREVQQEFRGGYLNVQRFNYRNFRTIPTGLPAEAGAASMRLYPNPTTGPVTLEVSGATSATVRDALGRVVRRVAVAPQAGRVSLDLSALPAGVYSVGLQTATGPVVRRVVRQ